MEFGTNESPQDYNNKFNQLVTELTRKVAEALASQQEMSVLSGCAQCGKRLLEFTPEPIAINGGVMVYKANDLDRLHPVPLCQECLTNLVK